MEWAQILIPVAITIIGWAVEAYSRKSDIAALNEQIGLKKEQVSMQRSTFNKPPFSDPEWMRDSIFRLTINGSRPVYVESIEPVDSSYPEGFSLYTPVQQSFKPTETIDYMAVRTFDVVITWRWADMPEMPMETIRRRGIKPSM